MTSNNRNQIKIASIYRKKGFLRKETKISGHNWYLIWFKAWSVEIAKDLGILQHLLAWNIALKVH